MIECSRKPATALFLSLRHLSRRVIKYTMYGLSFREAFAVNALSESHTVEYGKEKGDFKVDYKYTLEIGGRSKDFSQIAGMSDSFINTLTIKPRRLPVLLLRFYHETGAV